MVCKQLGSEVPSDSFSHVSFKLPISTMAKSMTQRLEPNNGITTGQDVVL